MRSKVDLAFQAMEADILKQIKDDSDLRERFRAILIEAKAKIEAEDE